MKLNKLLLALAASGIATSAFATNGYFAHGVGVKAKAMGGASIAFAEDGFGAASNPANLAQVKDGYSIGVSAFAPDRGVTSNSSLTGNGGPAAGAYDGNEAAGAFAVPEFAYVKSIDNNSKFAVVVYGNGGMNTDYGRAMFDYGGTDGVDVTTSNLEQLFISPTYSRKLNDQHTIGASLNLVYQTFEATGLDMFKAYTPSNAYDPGDHGVDSATGVGIKLGWNGVFSNGITAGAYYQPKTKMGKFDKYKYLFAESGGFDIPETYGAGMSFVANPKTTVAMDIVQINYSGIRSLANTNNHNPDDTSTDLGTVNGKGFGWKDMTVYKLGVAHQLDANTMVRVGWNYGEMPIVKTQIDFNLLAPAVVEHHFTAGFTRQIDKDASFSMHAMYAPNVSLSGTATAGTGTYFIDKLQMSQYEIGFQYSKKF